MLPDCQESIRNLLVALLWYYVCSIKISDGETGFFLDKQGHVAI